MTRAILPTILAVSLAACASKPAPVTLVAPPVVATLAGPAMPVGAYAGMRVPARLPDGRYPTPNLGLTPDAAMWHLRGALNVAALACREGGDPLVAGYNALLTGRRAVLVQVERRYAAQWKAGSAAGRDGYDDAMTRLYNFYAQPVGHAGFCAAAAETLALLPAVADADLPAFAVQRLASLDRPFTDFYAAYDAWAMGQRPIIAVAAPVSVAIRNVMPVVMSPAPARPAPPWLGVDPAIFRMP